jgi:hypothetical protein
MTDTTFVLLIGGFVLLVLRMCDANAARNLLERKLTGGISSLKPEPEVLDRYLWSDSDIVPFEARRRYLRFIASLVGVMVLFGALAHVSGRPHPCFVVCWCLAIRRRARHQAMAETQAITPAIPTNGWPP